jgi:hypothetical protein
MVRPVMSLSRTGLPVLSRMDVEVLGEALARDFQPSVAWGGEPLQAERFAADYLKLNVEYQWLSNNGCYLGAAVLGENQSVVLYDPEADQPFCRAYPMGTVLIDASLQALSRDAVMRFTLLHECAHQLLHRPYFRKNPSGMALRSAAPLRASGGPSGAWGDLERMEWQANALASCLLMPMGAVRAAIRDAGLEERFRGHIRRGLIESIALSMAAAELAPVFRVSERAAQSRLKSLGFGRGGRIGSDG